MSVNQEVTSRITPFDGCSVALFTDFVWFMLGWALVLTIGIWGLLCIVGILAYLLYRLYCWALEEDRGTDG